MTDQGAEGCSTDGGGDRTRRGHHARRARRAAVRAARAAPRSRAGRLGTRPRRLAGHAAGPVHRGHARRRPLHRRRSALLDRAGRRARACCRSTATEHRRHRDPFAPAFRKPEVRRAVHGRASRTRRAVAGRRARTRGRAPRSAATWPDRWRSRSSRRRSTCSTPSRRRSWAGTTRSSRPSTGSRSAARSVPRARGRRADAWRATWRARSSTAGASSPRRPRRSAPAEVVSNAAVMMFGGIETSEGMTTNLFWHLLTEPDQLAAVRADRTLARTRSRNRFGSSRRPRGSTATRRPTSSWRARGSRGATSSSCR